ncbi:9526_t:CDS:1 [Paraglomus brasilianum]|uniref:9526_t:CDS:1 n=1 Tax=Paraglomus brasilianum TaxID=144538 RepID=A0A9N8WMK0_9GLOM|nr:9526_t:CDS:1 [Paraglomus brasilianum]
MIAIRIALLFLLFTSISAFPALVYRRQNTLEQRTDAILFDFSIQDFLNAKAANSPDFDFTDDGCSDAPDHPDGFNFLPGCQRHDFGYRNYKKQGRFTEDNRGKIDNNLKKDLYNECAQYSELKSVECRRIADIYFNAVRTFGNLDV